MWTSCLEDYVEEETIVRARLQNHVQRAFAVDKFRLSKKMRNSFQQIAGDAEEDSLL